MEIILCDDNKQFANDFRNTLIKLDVSYNLDLNITIFNSIDELISRLPKFHTGYLLFLDIDFPQSTLNGIEAAKLISPNIEGNGFLYYLTNYPEFVFDSFSTHPENYLLKPVKDEELFQIISKTIKKISSCTDKRFITVKEIDSIDNLVLPIGSIVYLELNILTA